MPVLAVVRDLLFASRIAAAAQAAGVPLRVQADLPAGSPDWDTALVDLNLEGGDPLALIGKLKARSPQGRVIGFCSHVQTELQEAARAAGCDAVLSRSAFVRELPALLRGREPDGS